jgi:acetyl esterase/lipase
MDDMIFGCTREDWERWQREHQEFYDSLDGLTLLPLWENGSPGYRDEYSQRQPHVALLPPVEGPARGMVLICPGGGYAMKSVYEGRIVADKFRKYGFNAAVLDYRCRPYSIWDAINDAGRAIRVLRSKATELNLDPAKIAIGGFSAGGHLSSMIGTHFDTGNPDSSDPVERFSCRPDAVIQCYGAISFLGRPPLVSKDTPNEELVKLTPHLNVSFNTPPFFLWLTGKDQIVSRRPLYEMANALEACNVSYELHLFPDGPHGVGLADGTNKFGKADPHTAHWRELACEWLAGLGF